MRLGGFPPLCGGKPPHCFVSDAPCAITTRKFDNKGAEDMTTGSVVPRSKGAWMTFRRSKEARYGLLFALPAILGFAIFTLGPMILSLYYSLTDYSGIGTSHFIGMDNYKALFGSDPFFQDSLKVTLLYITMSVPLNITVSFFIAYLLSQNIRFRGFFRLAYYLPTVVPLVATSIIWRWLLDPSVGIINYYSMLLNLPKMRFLYDERTVLPTLAVMGVWQTGATMLIFLAGLQGIPRTLYEAADVDGASAVRKFFRITLPMMTPSLFFSLVVGLINGFQVFTQAFVITQGGPNNRSNFVVLLLFREAFTFSRMGRACAIAWIIFLIVLVLTAINFKLSNKWVYYESGDKA